ncbi:uncharacterized protein J4E87_000841 [Alternaria ethzedia]|uniref:uncharacterized protein n=1 Tax=Alternaria ethzedia TaxID=181014 RepID=UPI0020C4025F|nr:uncharacterized protein J4E87_000841 [Alternaria ethzedia]KAI4633677.1 hypothetical protein J4E87_000841 [Alternaria ethzedia]
MTDLLEGVGHTMEYETEPVLHTTPNDALSDSLAQHSESSNLSVDPFYEDLTKAFRYISSAGLWYLRYETSLRRTSADKEFTKIAKASMSYLKDNRECRFDPFMPYHQQYMSRTLVQLYEHMGYGSLGDAVFRHMTGWYDVFDFECARFCAHMWDGHCSCGFLYDDHGSIDILASRDVPTAVTYMHQTTNDLIPIDRLAFQDLAERVEKYLAFTNDYDIWPDAKVAAFREFSGPVVEWLHYENGIERIEWTEFKDIAAAVTGFLSYEPPPYFPHFFRLPAEIRKIVYHHYLSGNGAVFLSSCDIWACCIWNYQSLTVCKHSQKTLTPIGQAYNDVGRWYAALSLTCGQLQGEIVVFMLERTQQIVLNLEKGGGDGGAWFYDILAAIPRGDGLRAVKHLAFCLEHLCHDSQSSPYTKSPMVELALACTSLREIEWTIYIEELFCFDSSTGLSSPRSVDALLDRFALRALINCESLKQIRMRGFYESLEWQRSPSDWDVLVGVGKWLMKGILVRQERHIQVILHPPEIDWYGLGILVELDETDEKEVEDMCKAKKAKALLAPVQAEQDLGLLPSLFGDKV